MQNDSLDVLGGIVDRLAQVKATIASLKTDELQLKNLLVASGETIIDGTDHRAAISHSDGKTTTDWQAVAMALKPSRQLVRAHTTTGEEFYTVRLSARKTS